MNISPRVVGVGAMYFKFGRILVIVLNLTLLSIICLILSEFYGVIIFRNGEYTDWTRWTQCSLSCGGGTKHRKRYCTKPPPSFGGYNCSRKGPSLEMLPCNKRGCPVNGGYDKWSTFTVCSKECSGGVQKRFRYCNTPVPKFGGLNCESQNIGPYEEQRSCNEIPCKVDGGYTAWSSWAKCSATCGEVGKISRTRTCTNPKNQGGGKTCEHFGASTEFRECNKRPCPVDGGYGEWTHWDKCTKDCGGGFHTRTRACDSPPPTAGGETCFQKGHGNAEDVKPCNTIECDRDGGYSQWTTWSKCSKLCGGGRTERVRYCNNPKPFGKGKKCRERGLGTSIEADECNTHDC